MITSIVVNYRCAELTCRAVESLLADMPCARVIVVDNSVDPGEVLTLRAGLPSQVCLLLSPSNVGFGTACNLGVQASETDYIMFLNPDARVFSGCLDQLKCAMDADSKLGAVSPLQFWDASRKWLLPPAWLPTGPGMVAIEQAWRSARWASKLSMAYRRHAIATWTGTQDTVQQRALSGGAMMVRRSALPAGEPLFDPCFFMYYEDSDLSLRLLRHGKRLALVTSAVALHEWENAPSKVPLMEASQAVYLQKHFNNRNLWQVRRARVTANGSPLENPLNARSLEPGQQALNVEHAWQSKWLLELSPSPLMIPAIGHLGTGSIAHIPIDLINRFGSGGTYLRIGPAADLLDKSLATYIIPNWSWS